MSKMPLVTLGHFLQRLSKQLCFVNESASNLAGRCNHNFATSKLWALRCLRDANSEVFLAKIQSEQRYKIVSSRYETPRGKMFFAHQAKDRPCSAKN